MYDYLIVGAGYSGCVLAERIAAGLGKKVLLVDRDSHLGGLAHDYVNEHGLLVHRHGMHVLHTNSDEVFGYLSRFTTWHHTRTICRSCIDGHEVSFPFNRDAINTLYGLDLRTEAEAERWFAALPAPVPALDNAEAMALAQVGPDLYAKFFRGYTRKWWGLDPRHMDPGVTRRIRLRPNRDVHYQDDTHQAVPRDGYTRMFQRLIAHPNIELRLGTDHRTVLAGEKFDRLVFTGSLDEFFGFEFGELPYRTMRFEHETLDREWFQGCHQINYPGEEFPFMRIFEFKHATGQVHPKTTIAREYPAPAGPGMARDFPIPLADNLALWRRYRRRADSLKSVVFLGRLPDYKYYTMGQSVARALHVFKTKIAPPGAEP